MRPQLLEAIARNTLKKYDYTLILGNEAVSVPIEDIIESLGLSLEYQFIRKNGRILGETVFVDDYIPLYNEIYTLSLHDALPISLADPSRAVLRLRRYRRHAQEHFKKLGRG